MHYMKIFLLLFLSSLIVLSCTKKPTLEGFDLALFKADRGACKGDRLKQLDWLKVNKMTWKGVSSNDVEDILGKPDIQQLADRNQEYYIYFLDKGEQCKYNKSIPCKIDGISLFGHWFSDRNYFSKWIARLIESIS